MSEASDDVDPVIEAYKKDVDQTLLRENLKLTPEERLVKFERFAEFAAELRDAGRRHRLPFTEELTVFQIRCRFVTLEKLIQLKRAAGRPKDFEAIAELQVLLEERRRASADDC